MFHCHGAKTGGVLRNLLQPNVLPSPAVVVMDQQFRLIGHRNIRSPRPIHEVGVFGRAKRGTRPEADVEATDPVAAALLQEATEALEDLALAIDPRGRLPLVVSGGIGERLAPRMRPAVRSRIVAPKANAATGALLLIRRAVRQVPEAAL